MIKIEKFKYPNNIYIIKANFIGSIVRYINKTTYGNILHKSIKLKDFLFLSVDIFSNNKIKLEIIDFRKKDQF